MADTEHTFEHPVKTTITNPTQPAGGLPTQDGQNLLKQAQPYLIGGLIVALVLMLGYQQTQIGKLNNDLSTVTDSVKSSDVKTRLETQEHSLEELNNRLAYLDSKVTATEQKAQEALNRIKAHEDNDVIGNMIKGIKQTLGIK